MKKMNFRRVIPLVLAFIMLASLLPARLSADQECRHAYSDEMQHMSSCRDPEADYYKCIYCGEWVEPETGHVFLGHNFVQGDVGMRPTCEQGAYYEIYCTLCGYKERHETEPALGHAWSEWTVTKAPTAVSDGVRTRTCSRCGRQEQSGIPADPSLVSLSTLEVFILQQMLTEEGLYSGSIDGQYGPGTEAAVRAFQQQNGLSQTDPAMTDTFRKLSDNFLSRHSFYEPGEYLASYSCGLTVDPLTEEAFESNLDGTHNVTITRVGLAFERNGQRKEIRTSDSYRNTLAQYSDTCLLGNENITCPKCGYKGLKTGTGYSLELPKGLGDWVLTWDPANGFGWPVTGLTWYPFEYTAKWDAFDGADAYGVVLYSFSKESEQYEEVTRKETKDTYANFTKELSGKEDFFQISVTALSDGSEISGTSYIQFTLKNQMSPVRDLKLENGLVSWRLDEDPEHAAVMIIVKNAATDESIGNRTFVGKSCADISEIADGGNCKSYYVIARVFSHNAPNGGRMPSEDVRSKTIRFEKPRYVQTTAAMNVRVGPAKNYERIGGLGKGEIIRVIGEDSGFYKICYFGQIGWIMASCTTPAKRQIHTITLDPGEGYGSQVLVETNFNGRLDWPSPDDWYCPGCATYYFSRTKDGSKRVDDRDVFTYDTTLYAIWEKNTLLTYLVFVDEFGHEEQTFWVRKNHDLSDYQYPDKGAINPANMSRDWYTEPDGRGECVNLKTYIVPEDAPDTIVLYACLAKRTEIQISDNPVLMYEEPDTSSRVLSELKNEKVTVIGISDDEKFYHVTTQSGGSGYVLIASLEYMKFYIHFDANGGNCPEKVLYTD